MIQTFLLFLVMLLMGCNGEDILNPNRNPASGNPNAFGKWLNFNATPVTPLVLSQVFDQDEKDAINSVAEEWEKAVDNDIDFYTLPFVEVVGADVSGNYTSLSQFNDGEMGIYRSTSWFPEVSSFALAITQFRGFERGIGTGNEYIELVHADIILNYRDWDFSTQQVPFTYDIASVVLHELGHFIGLPHVFNTLNSVMYTRIDREEVKQVPFQLDELNIRSNYGISTSNVGPATQIEGISLVPKHSEDVGERGTEVQGFIELRADGSCHHFLNGKWTSSH